MDRNKAIEKIKKCLSLAQSNEPHEAARALAQANKLMIIFGINELNIQESEIEVFELQPNHKRISSYLLALATGIALAFKCTPFSSPDRLFLVGRKPGSELCGYAYDVLSRQLVKARALFAAGLSGYSAADKKRQANAYCEGWAVSVHKSVLAFASPITSEEFAVHASALKKKLGDAAVSNQKRKIKLPKRQSVEEHRAITAGIQDGERVKIHQGMTNQTPEVALLGND
jgi:hypothetical protein